MSWRSVAKCGRYQSPWTQCATSSRGVKQSHEQKLSKFACEILCVNSHWKLRFREINAAEKPSCSFLVGSRLGLSDPDNQFHVTTPLHCPACKLWEIINAK